MKKLVKNMVLVAAMSAAGSANAWFGDFCPTPYIGVDYVQTWMKGKGIWRDTHKKSFPGATLYLGSKFTECFGAEIGYTWMSHKGRTVAVDNFFVNRGIPGTTARFRTRLNYWHLDLNGYVPLEDCWELIGSIGVGWIKPRFRVNIVNAGDITGAETAAFTSTNGRSRAVFRLGAGAQYLFTECVGIRGMIRYHNTSSVRVRRNVDAGRVLINNNKPFGDAVSLSLGLFVKF